MLLPGFTCCLGLIAHLLLTEMRTLPSRSEALSFIHFYYFFIMFMNPKTFKYTRFNSYPTEYQTELLNRLSRERNCPKTELLREALHYFLRDNGLDDELIYDRKDHEKQMAEISPWWRREEEDMETVAEVILLPAMRFASLIAFLMDLEDSSIFWW